MGQRPSVWDCFAHELGYAINGSFLAGHKAKMDGGNMRKTACFLLMVTMGVIPGCSLQQIDNGNTSDLAVMFDAVPLIFDSSVVFMGTVVGQMISLETANGVARVSIVLDSQYDALKKNNLAAVVKNGRLHLKRFSGYGDPLPPGGYINGFGNFISYQLFKFKHIINNINMSADRRAQRLRVLSGLAG
jgi:hypothetical protein